MEQKILKKLEEMAKNPEGILSICSDKPCGKIKIVIESKDNWVGRNDFSNPEMYDSIVESYHDLGPKTNFQEGLSHGYCPEGLQDYLDSLKK